MLVNILVGRYKTILLVSTLAAVFGVVITFLIPKYYETSFSFFVLSSNSYDSYQLLNTSNATMGSYGGKEDISKLASIFNSRSFKQELVNNMSLIDYYGVKDSRMPGISAEAILVRNVKMITSKEEGLITIKVFDKDSNKSYQLAQKIIELLEKRMLSDIQRKNIRILNVMEANIQKKRAYFDSLTTRLRSLRTQFKILNTETQSEYLVKNLLYKKKGSSGNSVNPEVLAYMAGIEEVKMLEVILEEEGTAYYYDQSRYLNLKNTYLTPLKCILLTEEPLLAETTSKPNSYLVIFGLAVASFIATIMVFILKDIRIEGFGSETA